MKKPARSPRDPNKTKRLVKIIIGSVFALVIGFAGVYLLMNTVFKRTLAPTQVGDILNVVSFKGDLVHEATRDAGCSEYNAEFAGTGSVCDMEGEKLYVVKVSQDDQVLYLQDEQMRINEELSAKGWEVADEINFDSIGSPTGLYGDQTNIVYQEYYVPNTDKKLSIMALNRNTRDIVSWNSTSQISSSAASVKAINDLKNKLKDGELLYGIGVTYTYKTESHSSFLH